MTNAMDFPVSPEVPPQVARLCLAWAVTKLEACLVGRGIFCYNQAGVSRVLGAIGLRFSISYKRLSSDKLAE